MKNSVAKYDSQDAKFSGPQIAPNRIEATSASTPLNRHATWGDCLLLSWLNAEGSRPSRPIFQKIRLTATTVTMFSAVKLEMTARLTNTLSVPSPNLSASVLNGVAALSRAETFLVETA